MTWIFARDYQKRKIMLFCNHNRNYLSVHIGLRCWLITIYWSRWQCAVMIMNKNNKSQNKTYSNGIDNQWTFKRAGMLNNLALVRRSTSHSQKPWHHSRHIFYIHNPWLMLGDHILFSLPSVSPSCVFSSRYVWLLCSVINLFRDFQWQPVVSCYTVQHGGKHKLWGVLQRWMMFHWFILVNDG